MKDLMKNAGDIFEELKEAETLKSVKDDDIRTITAECGQAFTIICC